VKCIVRVLLVLCLLLSPPPTFGQTLRTVPEEPNFSDVTEWVLHFALGIVASFHSKDGMVYFSYPILDERHKKECLPYAKVGDEIHLVENGRLYIIKALPTLFRIEQEDWKMWDVRR
jgi:hypothetical protein